MSKTIEPFNFPTPEQRLEVEVFYGHIENLAHELAERGLLTLVDFSFVLVGAGSEGMVLEIHGNNYSPCC